MWISPQVISAEIIKQQTDNSTRYVYPGYNQQVDTNLGTGLSGIPSSIDIKIDTGSLYAVAHSNESVVLYEYTDATYTTLTGRSNESVRNTAGFGNSFPATIVNFEFASTTWQLDPTKYYRLKLASNGNGNWFVGGTANYTGYPYGTTGTWTEGCYQCNNLTAVYFILYGSIPNDTTTRINTVTPYNGELTATSTTFALNITGYINDNDFEEGMEIETFIQSYTADMLVGQAMYLPQVYKSFTFPISTSGSFDISTTTNMQNAVLGNWRYITKVTKPRFTISGFDFMTQTLVSTSTSFKIATSTGYDKLLEEIDLIGEDLAGLESAYDCNVDFSSIFSLENFRQCIGFLFVPSKSVIDEAIQDTKEEILVKFPIGYVTDFITILTDTSTSTIPSLDMTLPSALGFGNDLNLTLSLDVFGILLNANGGNMTDNNDQTFYEFTSYYWNILIYLLTFFYILKRILGENFGMNLTEKIDEYEDNLDD